MHRLSGKEFTFQQCGAPSHRSKHSVTFLQTNVSAFIGLPNWSPNSFDLNPVDSLTQYSVWGALHQLVYLSEDWGRWSYEASFERLLGQDQSRTHQ